MSDHGTSLPAASPAAQSSVAPSTTTVTRGETGTAASMRNEDAVPTSEGRTFGEKTLMSIPDDVLLEIFSSLDAESVVSLSQVCKRLHTFRDSYTIWHNVHVSLLQRARYIDLQALDQAPLTSFPGSSLRRAILTNVRAEHNWLSPRPTALAPPRVIRFPQAADNTLNMSRVSLDQAGYITKFTSRHVLVPMADGTLLAWDMVNDEKVGEHKMDEESVLIDLAHVEGTRSLMGLTGKVAVIRVEDSFGMHIRLTALRIDVPSPEDDSEEVKFEVQAKNTLLLPFSSEVHILDASRKMICAAFAIRNSTNMGILVIFDWETEEAALFDTGIPYQYGRTLVGMHLLPDGETLTIDSELNGRAIRWTYDLSPSKLPRSVATWNAMDFASTASNPVYPSKESSVHTWRVEPRMLSDARTTNPYLFWELNQLPAPPFGVPNRVSTVIMYVSIPAQVLDPKPEDKTWRIAQHYSDQQSGPCAHSRTIATLSNPVLGPVDTDEHGMPLVCLSFNQFGWVTSEPVAGSGQDLDGQPRTRRVLKMMTFPDPGETYDGDLSETARTLDVPSDVLDTAYHVLLDSTQGLLLVATMENSLFVYRY